MQVPETPKELGLNFEEYWEGQREVIQEILNAFADGNHIVLLELPTGGGKSLIALSVAAIMGKKSLITTQTKQLANQYCHSDDTEILTSEGFVPFPILTGSERVATVNPATHKMEFQLPSEIIRGNFSGEMLEFGPGRAGFGALVTPNHRMYISPWSDERGEHRGLNTLGSNWRMMPAREFSSERSYGSYIHSREGYTRHMVAPMPSDLFPDVEQFHLDAVRVKPAYQNSGIRPRSISLPMDDFLEFLGYFLSEGCAVSHCIPHKNSYVIQVAQKKGKNERKIQSCMDNLPFYVKRKVNNSNRMVRWLICHKTLWTYLRSCGHCAKEKSIPRDLLNVSNRQLRIILNALVLGDGDRKGRMYFTMSPTLASQVQEIAMRLGFSSSARQSSSTGLYIVSLLEGKRVGYVPLPKKVQYSGTTYCVTVPNGIIITRYNGLIAIAGNSKDFPFMEVMEGRGNYQCAINPKLACDEGPCIAGFKCANKYSFCPYYAQKSRAVHSQCAVTNIHFFMYEANFVGEFGEGKRDLLVIDEGHLLENGLMSFISIELSIDQFNRINYKLPNFDSVEHIISWAKIASQYLEGLLEDTDYESDPKYYKRLRTQAKKATQIAISANDEWILNKTFTGWVLKPVWVTAYGNPVIFRHSPHILLMSATIRDPEQLGRCLGISPEFSKVYYMESDSTFPVENRPINFWPVAKIGYKSNDSDYDKLVYAIDRILEYHKGQKGIVHCVSYNLRKKIMNRTKYRRRFIIHNQRGRNKAIDDFIDSPGDPVLMSPSITIGLDLPDDKGRFNIIAKIPWMSRADEQVRRRCESDPKWYAWNAACSTIQACGRTTRSRIDFSSTYILDAHAGWFMRKYEKLFPKWWKKAVYRIEDLKEAVHPNASYQPILLPSDKLCSSITA